jgi:hypothetical protein
MPIQARTSFIWATSHLDSRFAWHPFCRVGVSRGAIADEIIDARHNRLPTFLPRVPSIHCHHDQPLPAPGRFFRRAWHFVDMITIECGDTRPISILRHP